MIWSDHSSIMNHGHIILTANAIYDPAFYYTSSELHGMEIQELMEKLDPGTTEDQLMCSETRLEDVTQVEIQLVSSQNARIKDVSRFCHGNHKRSKQENRLEVILGVVDALNHQQTIVAL